MAISEQHAVALVSITNELIKRCAELQQKDAQYHRHAKELAQEIADKFFDVGLISEKRRDELVENIPKHASVALETLNEVATALKDAGANTLGTVYQVRENSHVTNGRKRYLEIDDGWVIDINRYR